MGKANPAWLSEARDFCKNSGIKIVGWGPNLLTVEAKSDQRAAEIATQLAPLGFHAIQNEDSANAGWLDLSKNPAALNSQIASLDVSHRRWDEQIVPLIFAVCSLLLVPAFYGKDTRTPYPVGFVLGLLSLILFFREGARIWGWKLEILPEGVRVRRYFRWSTIPWEQIHAVQTVEAGKSDEEVLVKLASHSTENLGKFGCAFARRLRDRLRIEIAERRGTPA